MLLTPVERDKLLLYAAATLAAERKGKGLKLNYPESVAFISFQIMEFAREGKCVAETMRLGSHILTKNDVMDGIPSMVDVVQVEATFLDGTKLVTIRNPIR